MGELVVAGGRGFMGLFDVGDGPHVLVASEGLVFGPARTVGMTLVAAPLLPPGPRGEGGR